MLMDRGAPEASPGSKTLNASTCDKNRILDTNPLPTTFLEDGGFTAKSLFSFASKVSGFIIIQTP
jgi:hypothetical protein